MNVASSKSLNSFAYSKKESMSKKWRRIIMLIYQWFFTNKQLISVLKRILSMRELQAHYLSYVFALIPSEIPLILFCKTAILFLICETTLWRRSWRDINFKGSGGKIKRENMTEEIGKYFSNTRKELSSLQ